MLAESFLTSIAYKAELQASHKCQGLEAIEAESWRNPLEEAEGNGDFHTESEKKAFTKMAVLSPDRQVSVQKPLPTKRFNHIPPSAPRHIPMKQQLCEKGLDLYRSWSGQSLYQNYPDLHIGGDHIAYHTCDSGCVMDQGCNEPSTGPVLWSRDILSQYSSINEPLQRLKAIKLSHGDECGERTITLHKEPLSNSMINNYMESKVQELYKLVLEEKLTQCGHHSLVSNWLVNNIGELSLDPHGGASKALLQSLAAFGLQNTSGGQSSEFATPNLQISPPLCKRKLSAVHSAL
uniref:Uncharacterized protein n=1 Tax=Pogona vitticeps TaxID=103695 RepID=A0A6J0UVQ9_9SAUR